MQAIIIIGMCKYFTTTSIADRSIDNCFVIVLSKKKKTIAKFSCKFVKFHVISQYESFT